MASIFNPPKPKTVKPVQSSDAERVKADINRRRRLQGGSYEQTIVGSGLKTALGQ